MIRVHRSVAGREVLSSVERLMDGLLEEETRSVARITKGLTGVAEQLEARLRTLGARGKVQVAANGLSLLPTWPDLERIIEAPVGDLLAKTRRRTLETVSRQLKACEQSAADQWPGLAKRAGLSAQAVGPTLEREWLEQTLLGAGAHWRVAIGEAEHQLLTWMARGEPVDQLVARWCSSELTRLPGCGRGFLWEYQPAVTELSRRASVATVSGLLMAGYEGWNRAIDAEEAS